MELQGKSQGTDKVIRNQITWQCFQKLHRYSSLDQSGWLTVTAVCEATMLGWLKHDVTSCNIYTLNVSIHMKQKIHSQTIPIAQKTLKTLSWHNKSCIWQPWKHLWSLSIARLTTLWQRIFRPQISRMTEVQTWKKKNETREKLSLKGNLSSSKVLLSEWYLPWPVVTSVLRGQERRRVDRGQCVHLWDTKKKREGEKKERKSMCVGARSPFAPGVWILWLWLL